MSTDLVILTEKFRREKLLNMYGLKTKGWGVYQTYIIYDDIYKAMSKLERSLYGRGLIRAACIVSSIELDQVNVLGHSNYERISIKSKLDTLTRTSYVTDMDHIETLDLIRSKYFGVISTAA